MREGERPRPRRDGGMGRARARAAHVTRRRRRRRIRRARPARNRRVTRAELPSTSTASSIARESVAEHVTPGARLRFGLMCAHVGVTARRARTTIGARRCVRRMARAARRDVRADRVKPRELRRRVAGRARRRRRWAVRSVRTVTGRASLLHVRVERLRLLGVTARARRVLPERAGVALVAAPARGMSLRSGRDLARVARSASGLLHRRVGLAVARDAVRMSRARRDGLRLNVMALRA